MFFLRICHMKVELKYLLEGCLPCPQSRRRIIFLVSCRVTLITWPTVLAPKTSTPVASEVYLRVNLKLALLTNPSKICPTTVSSTGNLNLNIIVPDPTVLYTSDGDGRILVEPGVARFLGASGCRLSEYLPLGTHKDL